MTGTKYLSELVTVDMLQTTKLNIIKAPTGSGKTYFALHAIPEATNDPFHKVVYLIDTINGKEQLLMNYNAIAQPPGWYTDVSSGENLYYSADEKIVIMTYAKFGMLLGLNPDFHQNFQYIICDELHQLPKFERFSQRPNACTLAIEGLQRTVRNLNTTVIGLSATPRVIEKYIKAPLYFVPLNQDEVIHYDTRDTILYSDLNYVLSEMEPSETGICYISHITAMKEEIELARKNGISAIGIWSINNTKHPMTEEQLAVRESILKEFTIPPQYHLVFINASSETSLKIKSHVDYVIAHSTNSDTIHQVRGRVNSDLNTLYFPYPEGYKEIIIPEEYLGIKLFNEQKRELCSLLNLHNPSNRPYRWPTIKKMAREQDYRIIEGRENNRRYAIITHESE